VIDIDAFYDHATLSARLETLARSPVVDLESIGESPAGRELWCATATGTDVDDPGDRPALLVTANMHAREFAGSWTALHLLDRIVENYGEDPALTDLLDRRTAYVVPRVCPDGAEFVLETRTRKCRSRFVDLAPGDVRDPNVVVPGDLSGDGRILSMRWPAEDGDHVVPDDEPRLTLPRDEAATAGTFYRHTVEGPVLNYDGGPVSEVEMRSDFNRNFPSAEWAPRDWIGHGPYPLSEPEPRALAEFVLDHPNVACAVDLHCGNPAIFLPEAVTGDDPAHPGDAELLRRIGERGEEVTGFPLLGGYWEASGDEPYALPGSFKDWLYERVGVPAYVLEHGMLYNSQGLDTADLAMDDREHARASGEAVLAYHDSHPHRDVFYDWTPVEHPQLGEVEVGGWDWARYGCPAIEEMPSIAARVTDWLLAVAEWAPDVGVDASVEQIGDGLCRVEATVRNRGRLPTHLTERGRETVQDARPLVTVEDADVIAGRRRRLESHLDARGESVRREWVLRGSGTVEVTVTSPRGVAAATRVDLDGPE